MSYMLKGNDVNLALSLKNIVTNMISLIFVMSVFAVKNIINIYKKNIVFGIRNMQIKNLTKSVTNCHQNIFHKVKTLIYNIK